MQANVPRCTLCHYLLRLQPVVSLICLNPEAPICSCVASNRCKHFRQGFGRRTGRPGMLRQQAEPLRQNFFFFFKGELFTFLLHAQTKPPMSSIHTHSPSAQMIELCVCVCACVCGPHASCTLSFQPCFLTTAARKVILKKRKLPSWILN